LGAWLSAVPGWVANLKQLTKIDIDRNRLTELPDRLAELSGLAKRRVDSTRSTKLPTWVRELPLNELDHDVFGDED
jgi:Leucine-rich repeat (LRR) protein